MRNKIATLETLDFHKIIIHEINAEKLVVVLFSQSIKFATE